MLPAYAQVWSQFTPPESLSKAEIKARLKRMDADLEEDSRRYTYENGVLDVEASRSKINEDIKVLINKQNKRIADWTAEQKSVFDDLAMAVSTDGQPMKLINSVKSRYGCDAWTKLTDYYELKMKGDIRTLRKRLRVFGRIYTKTLEKFIE